MSRSFSNVKLFSAVVADTVSLVVTRKDAVAAAGGVALGGGRGGATGQSNINMMTMLKKEGEKSTPWVPDPVTGYYRPENQANQIDAVELRRMLLKSNTRGH